MRIFRIGLGGRGARSLIPIYSNCYYRLGASLIFDGEAAARTIFPDLQDCLGFAAGMPCVVP